MTRNSKLQAVAFIWMFMAFLMLTNSLCIAQESNLEYIIFVDGDTMFGKVQNEENWKSELFFRDSVNWVPERNWNAEDRFQEMTFQGNSELFKYRYVVISNSEGHTSRYDIGSLDGYSFINRFGKRETYTKRNVSGGTLGFKRPRFLRVISSGKANLLEFKYAQTIMSQDNVGMQKAEVTKYYLERKGHMILVSKFGFRGQMKDYFLDNRIVYSLVSRKDLGFNDLETILKLYNATEPLKASIPGYTRGYVELEAGAKLYGQLRKINPGASSLRIEFLDEYGKFQKIHRKDIKSYRRGHEEYVKKIPPQAKESVSQGRFMLVLTKGKVNLYKHVHFAYDGTFTSTVYEHTDGSSNVEEMDLFLEKNNSLTHVSRNRFKKSMTNYFSDCPEIADRIDRREFKYRHLRKLVTEYNSRCDH